jgi:hypothetical protein
MKRCAAGRKASVTLVRGPTGMAVYINTHRIVGSRPGVSGIVIGHWEIDETNIHTALCKTPAGQCNREEAT